MFNNWVQYRRIGVDVQRQRPGSALLDPPDQAGDSHRFAAGLGPARAQVRQLRRPERHRE
jgi:hypothetical protein